MNVILRSPDLHQDDEEPQPSLKSELTFLFLFGIVKP